MNIIGLTGSIGMGKSTTSKVFIEHGVPVFDADAVAHELYMPGSPIVAKIERTFPGTTDAEGVNRPALRAALEAWPDGFLHLNAIVHPAVQDRCVAFLNANDADLVVLDVPLLLEGSLYLSCNYIVVVTASPETQRARVLARPGMTPARFEGIVSLHFSDATKRSYADTVIDTERADEPRASVEQIIALSKAGKLVGKR